MPSIMGAVAKHIFLVTDPEKLEATVRTAFEIARTGRPGPVVVDVPKDVQNWEGTFQGEGLLPIPGYRRRLRELTSSRARGGGGDALLRHARRVRAAAHLCRRRGHQRQRRRALTEFATTFGMPVVTTLMGIGALDTTQPAGAAHARHARRGVRQLRGR